MSYFYFIPFIFHPATLTFYLSTYVVIILYYLYISHSQQIGEYLSDYKKNKLSIDYLKAPLFIEELLVRAAIVFLIYAKGCTLF